MGIASLLVLSPADTAYRTAAADDQISFKGVSEGVTGREGGDRVTFTK